MGKPWARYEQNYINHPKFLALTAEAICLWWEGKNYCDMHHTDGYIPRAALKTFRFGSRKTVEMLKTSIGKQLNGQIWAPLWEESPDMPNYFHMHDYLDHNDCREEVLARIARADEQEEFRLDREKRRAALYRDVGLKQAIRDRDGDQCRYCGNAVEWGDRRSPKGGTYDHVDPDGPNSMGNLVVACRGCNSTKGSRLPHEAGMVIRSLEIHLVQIKSESNSEIKNAFKRTKPTETEVETQTETQTQERRREETAARSKRPIFTGQRLTVFEWQLDNCAKILGPLTDDFDLHTWFGELDELASKSSMVIPRRDGGEWLESQLLSEVRRRGLPVANAKQNGAASITPERQAYQAWRDAGGCQHNPRCSNYATCAAVSARPA